MALHQDLIDADAQKVVRRLARNEYQAYLVGGCVRDLLLGRKPKDFDIATSATPHQIKELFRNCRIIGRRFRLAHIFFGAKIIETATFRANPRPGEVEGEGDGEASGDADLLIRHDNVFGTAEEDARRRDFTINGLFYDLDGDQVIDYVGGLGDLAARVVRTIGDPDIRFREDPVRILRAIKFAARLGFDVEPATWRALLDHRGEIPKCAPPRVLEEIYRLLRGGAGHRSMELLRDAGLLELMVPELASLLDAGGQRGEWMWHLLRRIDELVAAGRPPSNAMLLALLLVPFLGPELTEEGAAEIHDYGQHLERRTAPLLDRLRVARRDAERTRQILLVQRRLAPSRRRRSRPGALAHREWFGEALDLFAVIAPLLHDGVPMDEELARWRTVEATGDPSVLIEPTAGDEGDPQRRRRRRGGRRRRREPAEAASGAE